MTACLGSVGALPVWGARKARCNGRGQDSRWRGNATCTLETLLLESIGGEKVV